MLEAHFDKAAYRRPTGVSKWEGTLRS